MAIRNFADWQRNNFENIDADSSKSAKEIAREEAKKRAEKEYLEQVAEANREQRLKEEKEQAEKLFIQKARLDFFQANPHASESDWLRLKSQIRDEFLLNNFKARREETARPEWFHSGEFE
jgi:hypothetical protein